VGDWPSVNPSRGDREFASLCIQPSRMDGRLIEERGWLGETELRLASLKRISGAEIRMNGIITRISGVSRTACSENLFRTLGTQSNGDHHRKAYVAPATAASMINETCMSVLPNCLPHWVQRLESMRNRLSFTITGKRAP